MYARPVFWGGVIGGIVLFLWGGISHMALPWAKQWVLPFPDPPAAVETLKTLVPQNGTYYDPHGYFLAAAPLPDGSDKSAKMGGTLASEFVTNLLVGMLLAGLLVAFRARTLSRLALLSATMAIAASLDVHMSYWIWYGFSWKFTLLAIVDLVIGWFLAGIAIAWVLRKWGPKEPVAA